MAAVSAPAGAVSPCTDAATDSIRRRLLPVLTYFLADDDMWPSRSRRSIDGRIVASHRRRHCPSVDRSLIFDLNAAHHVIHYIAT